jgi:ribonuclease E
MKQEMLINAVHLEQKRMAILEDGKLIEFDIQMSFKQPITGNIYQGVVQKVERGLQAAFVNYGGKKDGFLPLRDVSPDNFPEANGREGNHEAGRHTLKVGQEILVQVLREVSGQKGALLTAYISLPGRYLVLLPNKESSGVSRKIEDEVDRKRLKEIVEQIKKEEGLGFIVRTAGMSRTKQELTRDYQHLLRLWQEIQKKTKSVSAPALIYQESDFGVRTLRDYFIPEITEIWVDDPETFKKMRAYCKAIAPRNLKMIQLYKEKTSIFDKFQLEDQIRSIYQDRVNLKSGGYLVIKPTEAMITIDVNSGRASNKRNVEETAFRTNIEAAEEIARQLRLRDLGGLIVIDYIDMMDRKNNAEVERTFKKALSLDRARIQLAKISKFGIMELSRQKKHSTIQEISYMPCPFCHGSGIRPSLEYAALSAFRKMESQAVKGTSSSLTVSLPHEVAHYLLNQKRSEICKLETDYEMDIHIVTVTDMAWDAVTIEATTRKPILGAQEARLKSLSGQEERQEFEAEEGEEEETIPEVTEDQEKSPIAAAVPASAEESAVPRKKPRRRRRNRHRKPLAVPGEAPATVEGSVVETFLPARVVEEAAVGAEITTNPETVAAVTPADPVPAPRRPAARRRRKKPVRLPLVPQVTIPAPEQAERQETAAAVSPTDTSLAPKVTPPRNPRKKKPAVRLAVAPDVKAPDAAGPEPVLSQEAAAESTPAPPRAKRRPYTRRRPKKATETPSSEGGIVSPKR